VLGNLLVAQPQHLRWLEQPRLLPRHVSKLPHVGRGFSHPAPSRWSPLDTAADNSDSQSLPSAGRERPT